MSLHKLTAGDGYTYLTRQVAAQDVTSRGFASLGDYYAQRGESPGRWMGRGLHALPGFSEAVHVTEAQMLALFGEGRHPDTARIEKVMLTAGRDAPAILAATRLGSPFRIFTATAPYRTALASRFAKVNADRGLPRDWPLSPQERARIRTVVARDMFTAEFLRAPADARELSGWIARASRQPTTAVAGYDLTFSPVKSVSTLWAVAPRAVADRIEAAHDAAVADTVRWLEDQATYSRTGRNGVQQVDVTGLIAAAFTHRDSRAGDPDLHTHVAISNKVQTLSGRWLALDGRPLHKATVAASERYNTRLEAHLSAALSVRFADRDTADPGKRPVREIVGIDPRLTAAWSARRTAINTQRAVLAVQFQADHGRTPTVVEAVRLAQQATLQTRQAKHEARSFAEQRATWRQQADALLGGQRGVTAMITRATGSAKDREPVVIDAEWLDTQARDLVSVVAASRATWQQHHVRAEAERVVRAANIGLPDLDRTVDRLVAAALSAGFSLPLGATDPISEPAVLRRRDGSSVYSVAGSQLYTSAEILAAEDQLLAQAQRCDGRVVGADVLEIALLELTANGVQLNPGQLQLVTDLAVSGARLQLALAPAGTGKTTAMRALAAVWTQDGGHVIGLAPSAAAAAVLRDEIGAHTDTVAKLNWSLRVGPAPEWVTRIGPRSLVIIDEAGMAGTLELTTVVDFVIGAGGSVRLVGDDQQLAAIGAGGILRDIAETVGAVSLTQVMRFTDPAEGAASLALRAGDPAAIGFYLDHGRIHVGDDSSVADAAYAGWRSDRAAGRDAVMLAPTRELVAGLNTRARADRLADTADPAGTELVLADGSRASAGDTIITRANNRRIPITATDWVKNGDRWTVTGVRADGVLDVVHVATRRRVALPADYARAHVALGYATTAHGAQGVTADTCHTVATSAESRQLLYVAMTRGRATNHLYLSTASDGDPHEVITRDALLPPTAADILHRILGRDDSPTSATGTSRDLADPVARLGQASDRYGDALSTAAVHHLGPDRLAALDETAERTLPGLSGHPAYPTLRAHLALLTLDGHDAVLALNTAIAAGDLNSARDPAAVLDWRLDPTGDGADAGPLAWLPAVPAALVADSQWAPYLHARAQLIHKLGAQVRANATAWNPRTAPAWAIGLLGGDPTLRGDVAVWRAATNTPGDDDRPTGPRQLFVAERRAQRDLDHRIAVACGGSAAATTRWAGLAAVIEPRITGDPFWPQLADKLSAASRAGIDIAALAIKVGADRPLPDEYPAAALWWRLSRQLAPAADTTSRTTTPNALAPPWVPAVVEVLGQELADSVLAAPAWPALVAAVTDARHAGWPPGQVLATAFDLISAGQGDEPVRRHELGTALTWRIEMLAAAQQPELTLANTTPPEPPPDEPAADEPPVIDLDEEPGGPQSFADEQWLADLASTTEWAAAPRKPGAADSSRDTIDASAGAGLPQVSHPHQKVSVVPGDRIVELNAHAAAFYVDHYARSWAAPYLRGRLGTDLLDDPRFAPGYAPPGWTTLTDHLRGVGATDAEILAAGLASRTRHGHLVDRFRDRLMLPIYQGDQVVGFIGRRHPDHDEAGPKYLNTSDTALFHKGDQLFGMHEGQHALHSGAIPVLVEGPIDAIAVTLAGDGEFVGVAPLGTAFTDAQADTLRPFLGSGKPGVIVATDADQAGRAAAYRAYWPLVVRGDNPQQAQIPPGMDPAGLLTAHGRTALRDVLKHPNALSLALIDERIDGHRDRLDSAEGTVLAMRSAAEVVGPLAPEFWLDNIAHINALLGPNTAGLAYQEVFAAGQACSEQARTGPRHPTPTRAWSPARVGEPAAGTGRHLGDSARQWPDHAAAENLSTDGSQAQHRHRARNRSGPSR